MTGRKGFDSNRRIKLDFYSVVHGNELVHYLLEQDLIVDSLQSVNFLVQPD